VSEEMKGLEMRMEQKLKRINDDMADVKDDLKEHVRGHTVEHRAIDCTLVETTQRITFMESIIPELKDAIKSLVEATSKLNDQMITQSIYNRQNTDFRLKFTWKEITALTLALVAIITAFGGKV